MRYFLIAVVFGVSLFLSGCEPILPSECTWELGEYTLGGDIVEGHLEFELNVDGLECKQ